MCHQAWLIFVFLVEMGFGQVGIKLPTSGDPPKSASQSAGITGMSHCTCPFLSFFLSFFFLRPILALLPQLLQFCDLGLLQPLPSGFEQFSASASQLAGMTGAVVLQLVQQSETTSQKKRKGKDRGRPRPGGPDPSPSAVPAPAPCAALVVSGQSVSFQLLSALHMQAVGFI